MPRFNRWVGGSGQTTSTSTPSTTPGVDMTGADLVREAYLEAGIYAPTDTLSGEDADYGLSKLNRLLDRWNANPRASFSTGFEPFTLTPNLSPHLLGPSGTWEVTDRPLRIDWANLIIDNDQRIPIAIRSKAWYQDVRLPTLSTDIPTDLYYEPAAPNGKLYFWPVPSTAYDVELWVKGLFAALTLDAQITAPQGYRDAVVLSLAETLIGPFTVPMPQTLPEQAREARAIIFANNDEIPTLQSDASFGCPGSSYDYRTGEV